MPLNYLFYVAQAYSFDILRPLQTEIRRRGGNAAWFLANPKLQPSMLTSDEVLLNSVDEVKAFCPDAVFVPGNVVPDFFPGVKVQVFHGLEYKKKGHFAIRDFFDLYCTHGPITTNKFNELALQHPHFRVIETGWPKLDPYFALPQPNNAKPVIVYAPTFSPALSSIPLLHEALGQLCESEAYEIVVKFHPKTSQAWQDLVAQHVHDHFTISVEPNLLKLICHADIVISDTSSAVDEALLLGKPVITFNNKAPQDALYNITDASQLAEAVTEALSIVPDKQAVIQDYIQSVHPYQDGLSSARILDATSQVIDLGIKRKPLNLLRKFKIRKKLKYYRLR